MRIVPFEGRHLEEIEVQAAQGFVVPHLCGAWGRALEGAGPSFSAVLDTRIIGCSGVLRIGAHRGIAWALLADVGPKPFLRIHRAVRRFLDEDATPRLEIYVRRDHPAGHRWARALGFEWECGPLRRFDPEGNDYDVYARLKDV